jgi:hypothetical protein
MSGIDFNNILGSGRVEGSLGVNNTSNIKKTEQNLGAFTYGFPAKNSTGFTLIDSLKNKFTFEAPTYPKGGFLQFNPTEGDYREMAYLDGTLDAPEFACCES